MRDSSPCSPQRAHVSEKESDTPVGANKRLANNPFPSGAGRNKFVDCVCTTQLSRFAYRHNNESSLITFQILGFEGKAWPVGRTFLLFCAS